VPDCSSKDRQPPWQQRLHLSKDHDASLKSQLRQSLVAAILDGHIPHYKPLPSSRGLASQLGVARNTVVRVYELLLEDGYLISEERRGYFVNLELVNNRVSRLIQPIKFSDTGPNWRRRLRTRFTKQQTLQPAAEDWCNFDYAFTNGPVDPTLFPNTAWRDCCRQSLETGAVTDWMPDSVDRDDPLLLEQIQRRLLPRRGVWVDKDEILVTMGAQNALYLLATLLVNAGDRVGFEDPGHVDARNVLELRGCDIVPLPVDEDGLVVDDRINECGVVYCTPGHQIPTSATLSLERRHELLHRAAVHDLLIVEAEYESEVNSSRSNTPALKSLDINDRVIYVGSLSGTLAPGLRLGYMVGSGALIEEVRALRRLMLRHPPTNNQNAAARFIALGHHDSLLRRLSLSYRERWHAMDAALKKYWPDSRVVSAQGAGTFWLKLPQHIDADEVVRVAAKNDILVVAGDSYLLKPGADESYLCLGYSCIPVEKIACGIAKLAMLIDELSGVEKSGCIRLAV